MIIYVALLGYALVLHLLLIFLFVRGNYWKSVYQNVLLDSYALERVRVFFQTLEPILKICYKFLDRLRCKKGRPPTDYRFQFRFLLWWKFFQPIPLTTALRKVNHSPELQQVLEAPQEPYTRFSLGRFLKKLGVGSLTKRCFWILADFIQQGILDFSQVILDSFPIESFLNTAKCLKMPKFDRDAAQRFFKELDLDKVIQLLPKAHWKAAPYADKLKCWIHQHIWDVPSFEKCHNLVFGSEDRQAVMGLIQGWKSAQTYREFAKWVVQLTNFKAIEQAVVSEVGRVLNLLEIKPKVKELKTIEDLGRVFHVPHRLKDPDISLAHCPSKNLTFMGRGGLVAAAEKYEIPLLVKLTAKYKQSEASILDFLTTLHQAFGGLLKDVKVLGDAEFGTQAIKEAIEQTLQAIALVESYGNSQTKTKLSKDDKKIRLSIERVIARLDGNFQIEQPRTLGTESVDFHTQLCWLCDLLLVTFNVLTGNMAHPHSMRKIRG